MSDNHNLGVDALALGGDPICQRPDYLFRRSIPMSSHVINHGVRHQHQNQGIMVPFRSQSTVQDQSRTVTSGTIRTEIEHSRNLSQDIGALFMSDEYSDVTLVVEGKKFHAHKVILAARSEYFRALLFGGMREANQEEVELKGASLNAFDVLLKYVYTGHMLLDVLQEETVLDVLGLAHQFGFLDLENALCEYLQSILHVRNVCAIYDAANLFQLKSLEEVCTSFIDGHATEILHHDTFLTLSASSLREMLQRDSFYASEIEIYRAVSNWIQLNPHHTDTESVLSTVRLSLITIRDLSHIVRPTNLVSPDVILDAIQLQVESRDTHLQHRGFLVPDENVGVPRLGAQVLTGELRPSLLDGDYTSYDMEHGFSRHPIEDGNPAISGVVGNNAESGITVKLGAPYIINHIGLLLWDRDSRAYSYYIEVSMDGKDWLRVVDHTGYLCRSWQRLFFNKKVVRFIRVVGTHNTVNRVFHLVHMECMYTSNPLPLERGLVVPYENVATVSRSAVVIEGVSRSRNALLNGDTKNYDWDSGYTCHQLGSGAIVVQLAQPYIIGSMRLLLWDCDDRSYSYYIEVSTDQHSWHRVVDKTKERCKSWQYVEFEQKPVTFIRIVGTHNTANEVFHCVHFECPAQLLSPNETPLNLTVANQQRQGLLEPAQPIQQQGVIIHQQPNRPFVEPEAAVSSPPPHMVVVKPQPRQLFRHANRSVADLGEPSTSSGVMRVPAAFSCNPRRSHQSQHSPRQATNEGGDANSMEVDVEGRFSPAPSTGEETSAK